MKVNLLFKEMNAISIFSERLKGLRTGRKISQKQLAKQLNYGYTAGANYESGRNEPSISDLCRIADFFNVSVDYLVGRTENMMSHKSPELHKLLNNITLFDIMSAVQYVKNDMEG